MLACQYRRWLGTDRHRAMARKFMFLSRLQQSCRGAAEGLQRHCSGPAGSGSRVCVVFNSVQCLEEITFPTKPGPTAETKRLTLIIDAVFCLYSTRSKDGYAESFGRGARSTTVLPLK